MKIGLSVLGQREIATTNSYHSIERGGKMNDRPLNIYSLSALSTVNCSTDIAFHLPNNLDVTRVKKQKLQASIRQGREIFWVSF